MPKHTKNKAPAIMADHQAEPWFWPQVKRRRKANAKARIARRINRRK